MPAADVSSTCGSTSVRGRVRSPHMAKLQAASVPTAYNKERSWGSEGEEIGKEGKERERDSPGKCHTRVAARLGQLRHGTDRRTNRRTDRGIA